MKKIIVIILAFLVIVSLNDIGMTEEIIIPNESIRIRVIANSNSKSDQKLKGMVRQNIQTELKELLKEATTIDEVRTILKSNLRDVEYTVSQTINSSDMGNTSFSVNYGENFFPRKTYKGVEYKEGNYESLVITLGKSEGDNWWCVLFPPLCLLEEDEDIEKVEYKSFVKEIIDKYF